MKFKLLSVAFCATLAMTTASFAPTAMAFGCSAESAALSQAEGNLRAAYQSGTGVGAAQAVYNDAYQSYMTCLMYAEEPIDPTK